MQPHLCPDCPPPAAESPGATTGHVDVEEEDALLPLDGVADQVSVRSESEGDGWRSSTEDLLYFGITIGTFKDDRPGSRGLDML